MNNYNLKGKRVAALDYGRKRIGMAVCDELHVTVTPIDTLFFDTDSFWEALISKLSQERVEAIVVGVPFRHDNKETEIIREINKFTEDLKNRTGLLVYQFDESYSSHRAVATLLEIGARKKKRSKKGNIDKVAAAIILRDFLAEFDVG